MISSVGSPGLDPLTFLLGICNRVTLNTHKQLFVFYAAFYSRKTILPHWRRSAPPMVSQWKAMIDSILPL